MVPACAIVAVLLAAAALWALRARRRVITARDGVDAAWHAVDGALRRRHALAGPALAELRERAASSRDPFARATAEHELLAALEAQARAGDADLRTRLDAIADELTRARRVYNADVRYYLAARRRAPRLLLRGIADVAERPYYDLDGSRGHRAPGAAPALA